MCDVDGCHVQMKQEDLRGLEVRLGHVGGRRSAQLGCRRTRCALDGGSCCGGGGGGGGCSRRPIHLQWGLVDAVCLSNCAH